MENRGLLFIPDISGFTRFVSETEIDHSRQIIQELLEILINANEIGLEISEIEGDAILFYRFGKSPDLEVLYHQVEKMFCDFHRYLLAYEHRRYCQCKACLSAINLTLKVITHYGEFTGYNVKNFSKLIGKDIIVAHQLLKNDIPQHEYWLVTPPLAGQDAPPVGLSRWIQWNSSAKQTETGEISFHYAPLSRLRERIQPEPSPQPVLAGKTNVLSFSKEYETDLRTMLHAAGDFNYRSRWMEGVKAVEELEHILPRVGMRCRCILENGQTMIYSTSYSYQPEKVEFSETDEKGKSTVNYIIEQAGDFKTRLTIEIYLPKNILVLTWFKLKEKKRMEAIYQKSLQNLTRLVKEIKLPSLEE